MQLHSFTVGPFAENTYLLVDKKEALLIDPGFYEQTEINAFQQKMDETGASLKAVVLTHAHVDHVLGLQKVLDLYEVPVYLNNSDHYLWNNFGSQARMFGFEANDFNFEPEPLPAQEDWTIGTFTFDVLSLIHISEP